MVTAIEEQHKDEPKSWTIDTLRVYLLDTINERDRKYEQRFAALDKSIADANQSIKEALAAALASTREALDKATINTQQALTTANDNIKVALTAIDQRFATINAQLGQQQDSFARKTEIQQAIDAMEKAGIKAEQATEKRFDQINDFAKQFEHFARKEEVNIQFKSLSEKIDVVDRSNVQQMGRAQGFSTIGNIVLSVVIGLGALATVAALLFARFNGH